MAPHTPPGLAALDRTPDSFRRSSTPADLLRSRLPARRRSPPLLVRANFIPKSLKEPPAPVREDDERKKRLHEVFLTGGVAVDVAGDLGIVDQP